MISGWQLAENPPSAGYIVFAMLPTRRQLLDRALRRDTGFVAALLVAAQAQHRRDARSTGSGACEARCADYADLSMFAAALSGQQWKMEVKSRYGRRRKKV